MQLHSISRLQLNLLIVVVVSGGAINVIPSTVLTLGNKDGWISILLTTLIYTIISLLYVTLANNYINITFIEMTSHITGKYIGRIICLLYSLFFLQLTVQMISLISFYMNIFYFPETPRIVFVLMIVALLLIINYHGITTLSRFNELVFPVIIFGIFFTLVLLIPEANFNNIFPILAEGMKPVIKSTINILGIPFAEIVIMIFLYPYLTSHKKMTIYVPLSIISLGIVLTITTLVTIAILDINEINITYFTTYEMARLMKLGGTALRIESLFGLAFLLAMFIKIATFSYIGILLFNQTFNIKKEKIFLIPFSIIFIFYSVFVFSSYMELANKAVTTSSLLLLTFGFVLPIILLIVHYIKKYYKKRHS